MSVVFLLTFSPVLPKLSDEARTIVIHHLETLSGVAKGLTRSTDGLLILGERDSELQAKLDEMMRAREDPRALELRESISVALRGVVDLWSTDAGISSVWLIFDSWAHLLIEPPF